VLAVYTEEKVKVKVKLAALPLESCCREQRQPCLLDLALRCRTQARTESSLHARLLALHTKVEAMLLPVGVVAVAVAVAVVIVMVATKLMMVGKSEMTAGMTLAQR